MNSYKRLLLALVLGLVLIGCKETTPEAASKSPKITPFVWEAANFYFLLTDRFNNGNTANDLNFKRTDSTAILRGFKGGDIAGITQKIEEGYFNNLGINAIWLTPVVEQIHGATDEGTGNTYGYHGYWTKDWTAIDPNFGTLEDLENLVATAHKNQIRIVLDVVLNHTGPVTAIDPVWPKEWVRTGPACTYDNYNNTTACTLVKNLPDILTNTDQEVALPEGLLAKWKAEGRLDKEVEELDQFFKRTGYPRAPRFYIIKWLTDYIQELGVDGFRVDTVKHADEKAWEALRKEADFAFESWKKQHPDQVLDQNKFYMVGEVYNYGISGGRAFDFGDKKVDYFAHGFNGLINFELKQDAHKSYEEVFTKYDSLLHSKLKGKTVLNYMSSHDDAHPFDPDRSKARLAANMLLLTPGASQVYYGDETLRPLQIKGAQGDANLRSFMNWDDLDQKPHVQELHKHYQKLGRFRANHPAIGAGQHKMLINTHYVFSRTFIKGDYKDQVVVALGLPKGKKTIVVKDIFSDGTTLKDSYSNTLLKVKNGEVTLDNTYDTALLEVAPN